MPGRPGKFLAEYWLDAHKIGYLVVQSLDDAELVQSFLFLTMDGTPEGDELRRQLRLTRRDKQYTGLDDIRTFLLTDVATDPELVAILTECGCGHLFRIIREDAVLALRRGPRDELRKYLRLPDGSRQVPAL